MGLIISEERFNQILIETLVVSNILRDNLDIIKDQGLNQRKLSKARVAFTKELDSFLKGVFNQEPEELEILTHEIDLTSEALRKISELNREEKEKLIEKL